METRLVPWITLNSLPRFKKPTSSTSSLSSAYRVSYQIMLVTRTITRWRKPSKSGTLGKIQGLSPRHDRLSEELAYLPLAECLLSRRLCNRSAVIASALYASLWDNQSTLYDVAIDLRTEVD